MKNSKDKIKIIKMYINGWKSIQNEIGINFNNEDSKLNVVAISGTNNCGKTTFIEAFNIIFEIISEFKINEHNKSLFKKFTKLVNKKSNFLNLKLEFSYKQNRYLYELNIDLNYNTIRDKIIKYNKVNNKQIYVVTAKDMCNKKISCLYDLTKKHISEKELKNNCKLKSEIITIMKQIQGKYLFQKYEESNVLYIFNNYQLQIYNLYKNNWDVWNQIVSTLNKIDRNIYTIEITKTNVQTLNFWYIDKNLQKHSLLEYGSMSIITSFVICLWIYINRNHYMLIDNLDLYLNAKTLTRLLQTEFIKKTHIIFTFNNLELFFINEVNKLQIWILRKYNNENKQLKSWNELTKKELCINTNILRYLNNYY